VVEFSGFHIDSRLATGRLVRVLSIEHVAGVAPVEVVVGVSISRLLVRRVDGRSRSQAKES
jgi:hypothetical protein